MKQPTNFRRQRAAFTLLEVTIVITVAGLLMVLAIPRLAGLRDASAVRGAMTELGATFATARQTAIARRTTVSVVLDTAHGIVQLRAGGHTLSQRPLRGTYGVAIGADRDSAVYDPRGLGYGLSNLSVTIRRGTFIDTLTMSRLGRVRW